jgi:drug/metabolite transporter (DMT)-like permease
MVLFAILISGSFPIGAYISNDIDPIALTFIRFLLASFLLAVFLWRRHMFRREYFKRPWRYFLLGGSFSVYFIFMFEALKTASPISTSSIFTLMPFLAVCLDRAFLGLKTKANIVFYLLVGSAGALVIIFQGSLANLMYLNLSYGEFVFFLGTLSHVSYAVFMPKLRSGEPAIFVTFAVMASASILILLIFPNRIFQTDWAGLGWDMYLCIAYLAIFASIFSLTLLTFASSHLASGQLTAYTFSTPFWVTVFQVTVFDQSLLTYLIVGGLMIFLSLVMLLWRAQPRVEQKPQTV